VFSVTDQQPLRNASSVQFEMLEAAHVREFERPAIGRPSMTRMRETTRMVFSALAHKNDGEPIKRMHGTPGAAAMSCLPDTRPPR
jgi:hypothetical protein